MKNFTKLVWILVVLILLTILWYAYIKNRKPRAISPVDPLYGGQERPVGDPSFEWSYKEFEGEFGPKSDVMLTATYPDGTKVTRVVETIEGGCNEYPSPDKDVYAKSKMIMCYYAGLGRFFKVVKDEKGYAVMRKEFEEATPDYNPPVQEFKELVRF